MSENSTSYVAVKINGAGVKGVKALGSAVKVAGYEDYSLASFAYGTDGKSITANHSIGLPVVDKAAVDTAVTSIASGKPVDFEAVTVERVIAADGTETWEIATTLSGSAKFEEAATYVGGGFNSSDAVNLNLTFVNNSAVGTANADVTYKKGTKVNGLKVVSSNGYGF